MITWRHRPRWLVVIVGLESGNVTELPFMAFTDEEKARAWAEKMNARHNQLGLTVYEAREIRQ